MRESTFGDIIKEIADLFKFNFIVVSWPKNLILT